jgi:hypothetical protein
MTSSLGQITLRVPVVIDPSREYHAKAVFGLLWVFKRYDCWNLPTFVSFMSEGLFI